MVLKEKLKKFATPLLLGVVVTASVGGYALSHAFAANATPEPSVSTTSQATEAQSPSYKASITLGQKDSRVEETKDAAKEEKEDVALLSKAKISKDDAVNAAKAAYPEATVKKADIGDENGNLVYEVKMLDKAGTQLEVKVDAGNGKVLATDKDTEEKDAVDNEKADAGDKENDATLEKSDTDNVEVED